MSSSAARSAGSGSLRRARGLVLAALLLGLGARSAAGQADEALNAASDLKALIDSGHPVEARERAEALLALRPDSYLAHEALGLVFHEHEGNLPRALFHLKRALRLFERRCGSSGEGCGEGSWRIRARLLLALVYLHGDMDRRSDELRWLDRYEERYLPKRYGARAWALMKLERYAEAREVARTGTREAQGQEANSAWTALCAVESEDLQFERAYEVCAEAAHRMDDLPEDGAVEYRNAAHGALSLFRFEEAERLFRQSTERPTATYSNPWGDLASLYTLEGRLAEALPALQEAHRYVRGRPAGYVYGDLARTERVTTELLLALGRGGAALAATQRAQLQPDRLGGTSARPGQEEAAVAILRRVAASQRAEELLEEADLLPLWRRPTRWWQAAQLRLQAWRAGRAAGAQLTAPELLQASLAPYHPRGADLPPWLLVELLPSVGPGPLLAALEAARKKESRQGAGPYFDLLEAEARWQAGEEEEALRAAEAALAGLPRAERMLRARAQLVVAQARGERDGVSAALSAWAAVLDVDPGLLRRRGVALPVRLQPDGDPTATAAARLLAGSRRLRAAPGGFLLRVQRSGACLFDGAGAKLVCSEAALARPEPPPQESDQKPPRDAAPEEAWEPQQALALAFLRKAFLPPLDLSQAELRSLDGTPLQGSSQALDPLMERLGR